MVTTGYLEISWVLAGHASKASSYDFCLWRVSRLDKDTYDISIEPFMV